MRTHRIINIHYLRRLTINKSMRVSTQILMNVYLDMRRKATTCFLSWRQTGRTTTSQERRPGRAAASNIFLGPSSCWRNPPRKARTMGGTSSRVPSWTNFFFFQHLFHKMISANQCGESVSELEKYKISNLVGTIIMTLCGSCHRFQISQFTKIFLV